MRVNLKDVRLGVTALTQSVCAGIPAKDRSSFIESKDVTNDFIKCLIDWCGDSRRIVSGAGKKWEVIVREVKG